MKSQSVVTNERPASRRFPGRHCSRNFWILDTESPGCDHGSLTARGPFGSLKAAEDWLRADAKEIFLDADKSCRDLGLHKRWAAPVHIVQLVKTVEQRFEVEVRVRLKTIIPANSVINKPSSD